MKLMLLALFLGMAHAQADTLVCESADESFRVSAQVDMYQVQSVVLNEDEFCPHVDADGELASEFYETNRDLTLRFKEECNKRGTCMQMKIHARNHKNDRRTFTGHLSVHARQSIFPNGSRRTKVKVTCHVEHAQ